MLAKWFVRMAGIVMAQLFMVNAAQAHNLM